MPTTWIDQLVVAHDGGQRAAALAVAADVRLAAVPNCVVLDDEGAPAGGDGGDLYVDAKLTGEVADIALTQDGLEYLAAGLQGEQRLLPAVVPVVEEYRAATDRPVGKGDAARPILG